MKLAVFLEHIYEAADQSGKSLPDVMSYAKNCGIDYLECDLWRLFDHDTMKPLLDNTQLYISSIYSHFDFVNDSREQSLEKAHKLLYEARFYGAEKVLCIPGFFSDKMSREEQMKRFIEGLCMLCDEAQQCGVAVTIEDFDDINSPCCKMADIRYLLDNVPKLRYTFDTGNFRYCLEDADEALTLLSDRVSHVHLKDRSYDRNNADSAQTNHKADLGGGLMYPAAAGDGVIGIMRLIERLSAMGYDGIYSIEHFGAADQLQYMKKSAENLTGTGV